MKRVWKCDHCSKTDESWFKMGQHEIKCSFNPDNRYCYTCEHHTNDGFYIFGETYTCDVKLSVGNGEDNGNCEGWEHEKA